MKQTSIWFAVGLLQLIYGLILLAAGIRQFWSPPPTVLANLHATLWAGIVLILIGSAYLLTNRSHRERDRNNR